MKLWMTILTTFPFWLARPRPVAVINTAKVCQTFLAALMAAQILLYSPWLRAAGFQNGSFESPDLLPDGGVLVLPAGDTRISGWVVGGTNQSLTWINNADAWTAYDGKYLIGFEKDSPAGGWIEQTFDTIPGKSYRVKVAVIGIRFDEAFVTWLRAEVFSETGGVIVSQDMPLASSIGGEWAVMRVSFTAVSGSSTLRFTEVSQRQSTIRLDNVSLEMENPDLEIALYPGIKVSGALNFTYALQYQDTVATNSWITLKTFILQQSPTLIFDTNGLKYPQRIYRAVRQP